MKKIIRISITFLLLLIMLCLLPFNGEVAALVNTPLADGKLSLENKNLVEANNYFKGGLESNPSDEELNFFYSITRLAALVESKEYGSNNPNKIDSVKELLDSVGIEQNGRTIYQWTADWQRDNKTGKIILPETTPDSEEIQNFIINIILPEIDGALDNLSKISEDFKTIVTLKILGTNTVLPNIVGLPTGIEIDYGDVVLYKSSLNALKMGLLLVTAYDLDANIIELYNELSSGNKLIYYKILLQYPNLLTIVRENHFQKAKLSMIKAIDFYVKGLDFIKAECNLQSTNVCEDQSNDLITIDQIDMSKEEDFRLYLTDIKGSIEGQSLVRDDLESARDFTGDFIKADLTKFFDDPTDLRNYLPEFNENNKVIPYSISDPTYNGTAPNLSLEDWNIILKDFLTEYTITIKTVGSGTGKIKHFPQGIECNDLCWEELGKEEFVLLSAIPANDSIFIGWNNCDKIISNNLCEVTMDSNRYVEAIFSIAEEADFSISGQAILEGGRRNNTDILLTLNGFTSSTTNPNDGGDFAFNNLIKENYTLTPSLAGYYFFQGSLFQTSFSYSPLDSTKTGQDFRGIHEFYDFDKDGLYDWWEYEHFGDLSEEGTGNYDNDDWSNYEEFEERFSPVNASPNKPTIKSPENEANEVELTPLLTGLPYFDVEGDAHIATHWQIANLPFNNAEFSKDSNLVYDLNTIIDKEQLMLDSGLLRPKSTYYWRIRHSDTGGWSQWSNWIGSNNSYGSGSKFTTKVDENDKDDNGIPDDQDLDNGYIDIDSDGVDDNDQDEIIALLSAESGNQLAIKTTFGKITFSKTQKYTDLSSKINESEGEYEFNEGVFSFRIDNITPGQEIKISFYLSKTFTANDKWFKFSSANGWENYTDKIIAGIGTNIVTLIYRDGEYGDADGLANGVIVDPSGPGYGNDTNDGNQIDGGGNSSPDSGDSGNDGGAAPPSENNKEGGGGGGGGCFLSSVIE